MVGQNKGIKPPMSRLGLLALQPEIKGECCIVRNFCIPVGLETVDCSKLLGMKKQPFLV